MEREGKRLFIRVIEVKRYYTNTPGNGWEFVQGPTGTGSIWYHWYLFKSRDLSRLPDSPIRSYTYSQTEWSVTLRYLCRILTLLTKPIYFIMFTSFFFFFRDVGDCRYEDFSCLTTPLLSTSYNTRSVKGFYRRYLRKGGIHSGRRDFTPQARRWSDLHSVRTLTWLVTLHLPQGKILETRVHDFSRLSSKKTREPRDSTVQSKGPMGRLFFPVYLSGTFCSFTTSFSKVLPCDSRVVHSLTRYCLPDSGVNKLRRGNFQVCDTSSLLSTGGTDGS